MTLKVQFRNDILVGAHRLHICGQGTSEGFRKAIEILSQSLDDKFNLHLVVYTEKMRLDLLDYDLTHDGAHAYLSGDISEWKGLLHIMHYIPMLKRLEYIFQRYYMHVDSINIDSCIVQLGPTEVDLDRVVPFVIQSRSACTKKLRVDVELLPGQRRGLQRFLDSMARDEWWRRNEVPPAECCEVRGEWIEFPWRIDSRFISEKLPIWASAYWVNLKYVELVDIVPGLPVHNT